MQQSMDTMSYSQMMLMVDLISKWVLMASGMMDLKIGGLDLILEKDSHLGLHIMTKMYFAHISYLSGIGHFLMMVGILQEINLP